MPLKGQFNAAKHTKRPCRLGRSLPFLLSLLSLTLLSTVSLHSASAQDFRSQRTASRLFAQEATVKADEKLRDKHRSARLSNGRAPGISGSLSQDLRIDTAKDLILESKYDPQLFGDYRGLNYLRYVGDVVEVEQLDEIEQSSLTQKLILFQTARTISKAIVGTPLERHYSSLVRVARKARDYTTLRIVNSSAGDIDLTRGASTEEALEAKAETADVEEKEELVEIKLHVSASNGIEPRVKFSDNLTLRLDPLQGGALLEFKSSF